MVMESEGGERWLWWGCGEESEEMEGGEEVAGEQEGLVREGEGVEMVEGLGK